ncbi:4Fe-4S dicluster domain-containing protein [Rhizobium sp. 007]|uniref:4Fe-4S dicluster domain-containing protein n=1 Tax=Rhizobium sp. 007 TaxID=2785056 RepID=UPI0032B2C877
MRPAGTSAIGRDQKPVRNVKPLWSRSGTVRGVGLGGIDMWLQTLFGISPSSRTSRFILRLNDPSVPPERNLPLYGEPARLYCPADVYEDEQVGTGPRFVTNAGSKTCDITDLSQDITWVPSEGGGPNYPNM